MSQDTHLFSVRRPRETLGGINYNSHIPQPASALKRSNSTSTIKDPSSQAPLASRHGRSHSSSRMSLAPNRPPQPAFQRSSSGSNLVELGRPTLQRHSSSYHHTSRMSFAPHAMTPRAQQSTAIASKMQRRSSVYSRPSTTGPTMNQPSFFVSGPVPAGVPSDKRRLRDRGVQNQMAADLEEYLTTNGFQMDMKHALGPQSLKSPTGKDFTYIFQWLYKRIDPAYQFQKSIDHEVPVLLKQLRYPYEKSITKSQLAAVGGQNWGVLLGMLHWLMQLAVMTERYVEDRYDSACAEQGIDMSGDRIIFRFLSGAYQTWLSSPPGDDENEEDANKLLQPHIDTMAAEFEQGNQQYGEELKILEAEHEALEKQIEEIERSTPDLAKLEEHYRILKSDLTKFEEYNSSVGEKVKRHEARNAGLQKELEDWDRQIKEAEEERAGLQEAVDRQGISVADIDRMNDERERLHKGVEDTRTRIEEGARRVKEREGEAEKKLAALEDLAQQFNSLCFDVGLREDEFELVIHTHDPAFSSSQRGPLQRKVGDRLLADATTGYNPTRLIQLDLRGKIKARINELRREVSKSRNEAKDRDEENRRLLFELSGAIDDKRHELEGLAHKVRSAEEEFERTKDSTTTQKLQSDAQIEKMEKELAKMRASMTESVQLMEQREMNTNIEYEQLTVRANALREELHTEVERMLNDVIKFKVHVQKSLEDFEGFVVEEVEQELGDEVSS